MCEYDEPASAFADKHVEGLPDGLFEAGVVLEFGEEGVCYA
jgi:hypothetical protein